MAHVKIASVPRRKDVNGPDDLIAAAGDEAVLEMLDRAASFTSTKPTPAQQSTVWAGAEDMATFLSGADVDAEFLDDDKRFLASESVTQIFSPRGLGKSLFALPLAVKCARRGLRVLYIDRDNPQRVVKTRLRDFGADLQTQNLMVITREKCPPLTDAEAWARNGTLMSSNTPWPLTSWPEM